jgi:hypothetical protein
LFNVQLFLYLFFFAAPRSGAGLNVLCWRGGGEKVLAGEPVREWPEIKVAEVVVV